MTRMKAQLVELKEKNIRVYLLPQLQLENQRHLPQEYSLRIPRVSSVSQELVTLVSGPPTSLGTKRPLNLPVNLHLSHPFLANELVTRDDPHASGVYMIGMAITSMEKEDILWKSRSPLDE
jgi:hypothetical protein